MRDSIAGILRNKIIAGIFFVIISVIISSCTSRILPEVDIKVAGDSVVNARESIADAREAGARDHAPEELTKSESLLEIAQELLRKGKNSEAAEYSFQADSKARLTSPIGLP